MYKKILSLKIWFFVFFVVCILFTTIVQANVPDSVVLNGTIRDFKGIDQPDGSGHVDFQNQTLGVVEKGLVLNNLDPIKKIPILNPNRPNRNTIESSRSFSQWYQDIENVNITIPHSITLTRQGDRYEYSSNSFFPINGKGWGNSPIGNGLNYHFTYTISDHFQYKKNLDQEFCFTGDDDVWVFIDNRLAIDLGGVHMSAHDCVKLNNFPGLVHDEIYDIDFFFAERRYTDSNFKINTNIVFCYPPGKSIFQTPKELFGLSIDDSVLIDWKYPQDKNYREKLNKDRCEDTLVLEVSKKESGNLDLSSLGCNFDDEASIVYKTSIPEKKDSLDYNHELPAEIFDWNTVYCVRVGASNEAGQNSSDILTFRTNASPEFSRMGMQFKERIEEGSVIGQGIDQKVEAGLRKCTISEDKCKTETDLDELGGEHCWLSANEDSKPDLKDKTFNLWFDYKDADTGINPITNQSHPSESFEHSFAFIKKGEINESMVNFEQIKEKAEFYVIYDNLRNNAQARLQFCKNESCSSGVSGNDFIQLKDFKKFLFPDNSLRVIYNFEILPVDISQMYEIFSLSANQVHDPYHNWTNDRLPDESSANTPHTLYESRMYTKRGQIGIDNIVPLIDVPKPYITGFNSFDIRWINRNIGQSAGIGEFEVYCYSDDQEIPNYSLIHYDSNPIENKLGLERILNILPFQTESEQEYDFGEYNECMRAEDKSYFLGNENVRELVTSYRFNNPDDYVHFDNLVLRIQSLKDEACNQGDVKEDEQYLFDNWISTKQGSTFSAVRLPVQKNIRSDYLKDVNNLFANTNPSLRAEPIYTRTDSKLLNISSDFLGTLNESLNLHTSTTNQSTEQYMDLNDRPRYGVDGRNWSEYFTNILSIKNRYFQDSNVNSVRNISELSSGCEPSQECFINVNGDLTIQSEGVCDVVGVIVVNGKLTIEDTLKSLDSNTACIYIVKNGFEIKSAHSALSNPSSIILPEGYERDEGIYTSIYDTVEGFFIVEQGQIIIGKDTFFQQDNIKYSDGLLVRGGLVQSSQSQIDVQRTLGLRNNIQPPVLMLYDPRHIALFLDSLSYSTLKIREMEF